MIDCARHAWFWASGWGLALTLGFVASIDYDTRPEPRAAAPTSWPAACRLSRSTVGPSLVMFVHPCCPCSMASLAELEWVMGQRPGPVSAFVLLVIPSGLALDAKQTELWETARSISGVSVAFDEAGRLAELFGAATSGQIYLYDASDRLVFSGGITVSRGHFGRNQASESLRRLVAQPTAAPVETPVFGCSLGANLSCACERQIRGDEVLP